MFEHEFIIWAPLIGLIAGVLVGATGVGGACFATPAMVLGLGIPAPIAIATDALFAAMIKLFGLNAHRASLTQGRSVLARSLLGSIPGAVCGVIALKYLSGVEGGEMILRRALGAILMIASGVTLHRVLKGGMDDRTRRVLLPMVFLTPMSFVLGFLVGLTSVGAGSLFLPLLLACVALPFRSIVAIDIAQGLTFALVCGSLHLFTGLVDPMLFVLLSVGGIPGVLLGARLHNFVGSRALVSGTASIIAIVGLRMVL